LPTLPLPADLFSLSLFCHTAFPSFLLRLLLYQNRARRPLRIEACNLGVPRKSSDSCNRANHQSELTVISRRIFGHRRCILFYITDTTPFQFPIAADALSEPACTI
ncbi:hypothetical protein LINPERHAP2_LOCUS36980, partial [Linum perenne]